MSVDWENWSKVLDVIRVQPEHRATLSLIRKKHVVAYMEKALAAKNVMVSL